MGSRAQCKYGRKNEGRKLIERCCLEAPSKQTSLGLLELSKFWEMEGQVTRARQVLKSTKYLMKTEWKIYFEAVMMEIRNGFFKEAEQMVHESLKVHFATGRLWATLIQLQHARSSTKDDFQKVFKTFVRALNEIPKSGEVWCEGARLLLNSDSPFFDVEKAERYLEFAIQFTP